MKHLSGLGHLVKENGAWMIILAAVFSFAFNAGFQYLDSQDEDTRMRNEISELKSDNQTQTDTLQTALLKIEDLQRQNNDLIRLNVCLSQFILGGEFTDRVECQKRISNGITPTTMIPTPQSPPQALTAPPPPPREENPPDTRLFFPEGQGAIRDDTPYVGGL